MTRSLSRWQAILLGLIVITGLLLGGFGLFVVGSREYIGDAFHVRASFKDVSGVEVGTRIHIKGVDAGEVEAIQLPETPEDDVILHLRIAGKFRHLIRSDAKVQIGDENLFGSKVVRILPEKSKGEMVADNAMLESLPPGGMSDHLVQAAEKMMNGNGPLGKVKNDLQQATYKLNNILDQAEVALHEVNNGKGTIGKLLKDDKLHNDLAKTLEEVNGLVAEVKQGKGTLGLLLKDEKLYGELTKTLTQINGLVLDVQDGKGSLGKLMNNTELYLEALKSLKDLQSTMTSFKQNADAIKALPVVRSYVVDVNKELNRPDCKRHRIHFAVEKLFDSGKAVLTDGGKQALDAAAEWLNDRKDEGSEVVVASFADPKKHDAEFAQTLTQKQSEIVADYLKANHKIHRMGYWWWSNRRVVALGCGTAPTPVPETDKLPPGRIELIVFIPIK